MSLSLLKRSISIVEENLPNAKKRKDNKFTKQTGSSSKQSLFDMIPEKHKLYGKYKNRQGNDVRYEKLQQAEKPNIEELRKSSKEKGNKAHENLQKLLRMGSAKMNPKITEKLIGRVRSKQRQRQRLREEDEDEKSKEEVSIFTEEDFKAFEKEYFNS